MSDKGQFILSDQLAIKGRGLGYDVEFCFFWKITTYHRFAISVHGSRIYDMDAKIVRLSQNFCDLSS